MTPFRKEQDFGKHVFFGSNERKSIMRDKAIEMAKRLITDSLWKSANLEGLGTTFQKTEAILANVPTKTTME